MQSSEIFSRRQPQIGLLQSVALVTATVLLVAYAVFHFNTGHWILLGLFIGLVMAMVYRIESLESASAVANYHKRVTGKVCSDGGTFGYKQSMPKEVNVHPVVHDGGSFTCSSNRVRN
jgi:hypothetical protein